MYIAILVFCMSCSYTIGAQVPQELQLVPRSGWKAKPPKSEEMMKTPVPFVVIHYSYIPGVCSTNKDCIKSMQWMQQFHQEGNKWTDIGYNFGIGSDGVAYEGRGWTTVGAHAPGFNNRSIAIVIIGDWRYELPPKKQLATIHKLIDFGVEKGHIACDYYLIGHRQVRATDCPGERLFREMQTWEHFCPDPNNCQMENQTLIDVGSTALKATIAPEH